MFDLSVQDVFIIGIFVVFNIIVGFSTRGKSNNFSEYASARYSGYSDFTIVGTIIALFCSASLLITGIEQMYLQGYFFFFSYFICEMVAVPVAILFYIPKIINIGTITLYEYLSHFYGSNVRFICALCEVCQRVGRFAIQLIIIGKCASYALNLDKYYCDMLIWFVSVVMMIYSAYGGLKSVSLTDIVQSITFIIIIPTISLYIWHKTGMMSEGHSGFYDIFSGKDPKMTFVGTFSNPVICMSAIAMLTWSALCLPLYTTCFQRIIMCKTCDKAQKLWSIGWIVYGFIILLILFIGIQLRGVTGGIDPATGDKMTVERIIPYMLDTFSFPTMRIMFLLCVVSLSISTADSEFNAISVLLTNDVLNHISPTRFPRTKRTAILSICIIGVIVLFLALSFNDIFKLLMTMQNFFLPIVAVPLSMTVLGFRTHKNAICIGIICGAFATMAYAFLLKYIGYGDYAQFSFGVGMIANFIGIMIGHFYYTKIKGWKNTTPEPQYPKPEPKITSNKFANDKEFNQKYKEVMIEKMKRTVRQYEEENAKNEKEHQEKLDRIRNVIRRNEKEKIK